MNDDSTSVSVYKRDKSTGDEKGEPLFYKMFDNELTVDLRIHMNKGDDKAIVFGECSESPIVRIIGGKGKDEFVDESVVDGYFLQLHLLKMQKIKHTFMTAEIKRKLLKEKEPSLMIPNGLNQKMIRKNMNQNKEIVVMIGY